MAGDPYAAFSSPQQNDDPYAAFSKPAEQSQEPKQLGALASAAKALEVNIPFMDRAVAGAKTYLPQGYGGTGQDYAANLATEKAKNAAFEEQNPVTTAVGGLTAYAPAVLVGGGATLPSRVGAQALTGLGIGALQGASSSPDLTNTQDTGQRIAQGELTGGALGAAIPAVAHGVGSVVNPLAAALQRGPGQAEIANLGNDVSAAYKRVNDLGAAYTPEAYQGLVGKIEGVAKDAYMDPSLTPGAASVIKNMQGRVGDQPMALPELDKIRQLAQLRAGSSPSAEERMLGGKIRGNIDEFISGAKPGDMAAPALAPPKLVVAAKTDNGIKYGQPGQIHADLYDPSWDMPNKGDVIGDLGFAEPGGPFMSRKEAANYVLKNEPARGGQAQSLNILDTGGYTGEATSPMPRVNPADAALAIQNARELAMRQFKANAVTGALDKAEINAAKSGSGGNVENTTRQRLAAILPKEPWSPDELAQLNTMIRGTPVTNTLRQLTRFGPKGNALMMALELGALGTGNPALMTAGAGGMAAQGIEALMRRNAQKNLLSTILAGGTRPEASKAISGNYPRAALAAALAGNADLQSQHRQNSQP